MRDHCLRHTLLLSVVFLLFSCSDTVESELVIKACLDQNGKPLPPGVTVSVEGVSEIWSGAALRFPVKVEGAVRLVRVKAGAGNSYVFNSKSQYAVQPGTPTEVTLRFFRPYRVTVEAPGQDGENLSGAEVFANGHHIGTTDERGRFTWTIDRPNTRAGIARAGARFDIRLKHDDEQVVAAPVILAKEQFAYAAEVLTGQERIAPSYGFAAGAEIAARETVETPSPSPQAETPTPRPSRETTPSPSTPETNPTAPITEAQPRPPNFEPANQDLNDPPPTLEPAPAVPSSTDPSPTDPSSAEPSSAETPPAEPAPAVVIPTALQQGDQAFATGRFEEAKRLYSSVPPDNPYYKRARQKLGEINLETKNYEGAVAAFEDIIREDPSEYAAYNNLAAVYLATESYNEALANLDKVLAHKHLIPRSKRRHAELEVRYTRASIHYTQFQNERDVITKKEQGLLAMSVVQAFIDQVPPGDAAFDNKRREMVDKLDDIRQWVRGN